jgi:hypothetical protein
MSFLMDTLCTRAHARAAQIIYLIGWSPDASQPKPLRRGSASKHLRDLDAELAAMPDAPPASASAADSASASADASSAPATEAKEEAKR